MRERKTFTVSLLLSCRTVNPLRTGRLQPSFVFPSLAPPVPEEETPLPRHSPGRLRRHRPTHPKPILVHQSFRNGNSEETGHSEWGHRMGSHPCMGVDPLVFNPPLHAGVFPRSPGNETDSEGLIESYRDSPCRETRGSGPGTTTVRPWELVPLLPLGHCP